jgi:hypothetical protein
VTWKAEFTHYLPVELQCIAAASYLPSTRRQKHVKTKLLRRARRAWGR